MTQKWNLQDIRPAEPRRRPRPTNGQTNLTVPRTEKGAAEHRPTQSHSEETSEYDSLPSIPVIDGQKKSRKHLVAALVIFCVVVGGGFTISSLTAGAEISIHPKVRELNINAEFTAYREKKAGELSYEIMTLEATGERQVKASGQEEVATQALGEIEIFKTTPGAERLIKNTRFATEAGLVYRIQESVVVPGALTDSGGKSVPGSIRAQVFADEAGDQYNVAANTRFTVPGFKEGGFTDLFNAMYAENRSAFSGGFKGPKFIIDEQELATARQSLQMELRDSLLGRVQSERPADFTAFNDSIAFTYSELPAVQYGDTLVTIREQATLQIPLFKSDDFASFIAKETIVGYEVSEGVRIDNLQNITFSYVSATTSASNIANTDSLIFKVTGVPKIVWTFDSERMKADLLGMEKTAFVGILGKYTGVDKGEVKVRPFWKQSFPRKLNDITITEVVSETK